MTQTAGGKVPDITQGVSVAEGKGWRETGLSAECLGTAGERLTFASKGAFMLQISEIARDDGAAQAVCSF